MMKSTAFVSNLMYVPDRDQLRRYGNFSMKSTRSVEQTAITHAIFEITVRQIDLAPIPCTCKYLM